MKKYQISKFYVGIYIVGAVFLLASLILGIWLLIDAIDVPAITLVAASIVGLFAILYQVLFDFQFGRFWVDRSGITMEVGFRRCFHAWDAVTDFGFVKADVGDGYTYWLYFSERTLSYDEKCRFLRKTRRDLKNIAFFQYNADDLRELLPKLPEQIAAGIQKEETRIRERMTLIERVYHK